MRNWAKKRCLPALVLVLCLLPSAAATTSRTTATPAAAQATVKASVAPVAAVSTRKAPAKPAPAAVKPLWSEIFVRADLQPDGQYKFVGGLTGSLLIDDANAAVRLNVTPANASGLLSPNEWRWADETFAGMKPVAGYPSVRVTEPLYMAPTEPLRVDLTAIAHGADGNVAIPYARMNLAACQGSACPQHLQIDLQVYCGPGGVQVTLATESSVPAGTTLRNGFITHPGDAIMGNNLPQRPFPAYGSGGSPGREVSQVVLPYEVGQYGIDAYAADSALAGKAWFIPGAAFAAAATNIY